MGLFSSPRASRRRHRGWSGIPSGRRHPRVVPCTNSPRTGYNEMRKAIERSMGIDLFKKEEDETSEQE